MISTSNILSFLSLDQPIETNKLEKALKLNKSKEKTKLGIAIKALEKLSIISTDDLGNITLNPDNSSIKAKIRCSSKGYCFAVREDGKEDIYIREQHLNHAWHGDSVLIKMMKEAERRKSPEGLVQCILKRKTSNIICIIKEIESDIVGIPLDDRILEVIDLPLKDKKYITNNDVENVAEVQINKYPIGQYSAEGQVVRQLPLNNGYLGDIDILLTKSNLQLEKPFPKAGLKDLTNTDRRDLTDQNSLLLRSWTDKDSPSLPAVFVQPFSGGTRLWLHSPAVSERFPIGGKIDNWIRERGESICLGNSWRSLHNKELISAFEFKTNTISEAVSLSIDINPKGEIVDWEFSLSRIKPVAIINSEQLESISKRKPKAKTIPVLLKSIKEYIGQIQTLIYLSELLDSNDDKTIEIDYQIPLISDLSELSFTYAGRNLNGWKEPLIKTDPQSLLNIFIKTANKVWYKHSIKFDIPTIHTESPSIDESSINEILKSLISLNIDIELDNNGYVSPQNLIESIKANKNKRVCYKILKQAINNKIVAITNTTSTPDELTIIPKTNHNQESPWCCPAVNYIDVINQNLIVILLRDGKSKEKSRSKTSIKLGMFNSWDEIKWPIFSSTSTNQISTLTSVESISLIKENIENINNFNNSRILMAKARVAQSLIGKELEGTITGVQSYGFFTEIPPVMIEGLVHVSTLNDDWYEYRSRQNLLTGRKNKKTYQLGDNVIVRINKVDILRNQIDLLVINNSQDKQSQESITNRSEDTTISVHVS